MSYKTIFSGSAGAFSGILRPRAVGLVTLRFFAKRLFSRDSWLGLLFCRLPCRATCGPAFILSASVSRDLCSGLFSVGFRVAWLVVRPLCHWAFVIAGATAFVTAFAATAALVALFIAETRPMDLQSHSYPANRPETATP